MCQMFCVECNNYLHFLAKEFSMIRRLTCKDTIIRFRGMLSRNFCTVCAFVLINNVLCITCNGNLDENIRFL